MQQAEEKRYNAPALEKGLDILEFLAAQPVPCSRTEIAESLSRTPSEIFRMLSVLEQRGYVQKQTGTTAYGLSLKLFELGHLQSGITTLRKAIRLPMEQLAGSIGEACHFSVQKGSDFLVMMERMPARSVCLAVGEGTTLPLTGATSGFVLMSLLEDNEIHALLQQDPEYQALSEAKQRSWLKRIDGIRQNNVEISKSKRSQGVVDIAMPIGIKGTDLCGALAVCQLSSKTDSPVIRKTLRAMRSCAEQINQNLGI